VNRGGFPRERIDRSWSFRRAVSYRRMDDDGGDPAISAAPEIPKTLHSALIGKERVHWELPRANRYHQCKVTTAQYASSQLFAASGLGNSRPAWRIERLESTNLRMDNKDLDNKE